MFLLTAAATATFLIQIPFIIGEYTEIADYVVKEGYTNCNTTLPLNTSKDICGDICDKSAKCSSTGACICSSEPTPTMLGGNFIHCTNWPYVQQEKCNTTCTNAGKLDSRVCWTLVVGNYCTCFGDAYTYTSL